MNNLLDGVNDTMDDSHMWLAPFMNRYFDQNQNGSLNTIYISFDQPVVIGAI